MKKFINIRVFELSIGNEIGREANRVDENGVWIHGVMGELKIPDRLVYLPDRFARKLSEYSVEFKDFSHLYIYLFDTEVQTKPMYFTKSRGFEFQWMTEYKIGLNFEDFNTATEVEQEKILLDLIESTFAEISKKEVVDTTAIHSVKAAVLADHEKLEIKLLEKTTRNVDLKVTYNIEITPGISQVFLYVTDKEGLTKRFEVASLKNYELVYCLVSKISIDKNVISIKPRISDKARVYLEGLITPITLSI